ncbi:unnamed protein product [Pleuronectes platessa]|uniref:Uncharacterized protein n=1 Tax=Pleuronectes platessa TaxID=8262 RepID=A0A9N7Y8L8_PLEPL|nr:unnamed protein product [Pleuronectes platessa]
MRPVFRAAAVTLASSGVHRAVCVHTNVAAQTLEANTTASTQLSGFQTTAVNSVFVDQLLKRSTAAQFPGGMVCKQLHHRRFKLAPTQLYQHHSVSRSLMQVATKDDVVRRRPSKGFAVMGSSVSGLCGNANRDPQDEQMMSTEELAHNWSLLEQRPVGPTIRLP